MADEATIAAAARRLAAAASSQPARVFLFGSYARGDARDDSDLDFLVVEPEVRGRRAEMVRLRQALHSLPLPIDVLVASEAHWRHWSGVVGSVYHAVRSEGRALVGGE